MTHRLDVPAGFPETWCTETGVTLKPSFSHTAAAASRSSTKCARWSRQSSPGGGRWRSATSMEVQIAYSTLKLVFAEAGPAPTHFENEYGASSSAYGPFMHFACTDGIAYGDGVIYSNLDLETRRWYDHRGQRYWPELVVKSASAP